MKYDLITILGPTASGKTSFAAALAYELNTEIISGDSRQIYKGMDIGTGKDLIDYTVKGKQIPYHLIDIVEPGYKYSIFEYQRDFLTVYNQLKDRNITPILCGGSGLYLESVLDSYELAQVPKNPKLRQELKNKSLKELSEILSQYKTLHNTTDIDTTNRAIRAIEIEMYYAKEKLPQRGFPELKSLIIGVDIERDLRRKKITNRLKERLEEGMIQEVQHLLDKGLTPDDLIYYGLEYKFVTQHIIGELSFEEMFKQLEIAIHQFAKRQMTWFRRMERKGFNIHWIDATLPMSKKVDIVLEIL
ncbi:MAG: tRNA (adenosine(37)-N6)-dimethylallyltransferase MiaA [Bacteroides sp.]|nr:tRNA (adenosine(37)-N6)-dimethylallyltransferase MiaA [Bacteroides sp.]MDD4719946.1 tRNA (adenosine(37)-N6)-dimethylallyltransferase MiaA [Bacteroides sp.]NLI63355.1 tRNA (adenosine(37)-N6)-dimethylallyltransferase MiaA [Bacteroidales bacterium]